MKIQMVSKWRGYGKKDTARSNRIPGRVLNTISARQSASEKLVGGVQLAVVIFYGRRRRQSCANRAKSEVWPVR
jgi:hypothetical protein